MPREVGPFNPGREPRPALAQRWDGRPKTARSLLELGLGHGITAQAFEPLFERHVVVDAELNSPTGRGNTVGRTMGPCASAEYAAAFDPLAPARLGGARTSVLTRPTPRTLRGDAVKPDPMCVFGARDPLEDAPGARTEKRAVSLVLVTDHLSQLPTQQLSPHHPEPQKAPCGMLLHRAERVALLAGRQAGLLPGYRARHQI